MRFGEIKLFCVLLFIMVWVLFFYIYILMKNYWLDFVFWFVILRVLFLSVGVVCFVFLGLVVFLFFKVWDFWYVFWWWCFFFVLFCFGFCIIFWFDFCLWRCNCFWLWIRRVCNLVLGLFVVLGVCEVFWVVWFFLCGLFEGCRGCVILLWNLLWCRFGFWVIFLCCFFEWGL